MYHMTLLHIGCGNRRYEGFVNVDKAELDISKTWPYGDETVDGIVSMHVLQQLTWRELVVALRESHRVLKKAGVMRFGCPMVELAKWDLDYLLGWNNINLFSEDLLRTVLVDRIGFSVFHKSTYGQSLQQILARVDNRRDRGTVYFDVVK